MMFGRASGSEKAPQLKGWLNNTEKDVCLVEMPLCSFT